MARPSGQPGQPDTRARPSTGEKPKHRAVGPQERRKERKEQRKKEEQEQEEHRTTQAINLFHSQAMKYVLLGLWAKCHRSLVSSHRHIQWAEMFAALAAVLTYAPFLTNRSVLLLMDNQCDVGMINRQSSRNKSVCLLVRALFDLAFRFHFSIRAQHIAGTSNVLADFLSRPSKHRHQPLLTWPEQLSSQPASPALDLPSLSAVTVLLSSDINLLELSNNDAQLSSSMPLCQPSNSFPSALAPVVPTPPIMPTICAGVVSLD